MQLKWKNGKISKRYEEWLNLSDEEREGKIAPLPFNIRNTKQSGIINRFKSVLKATSIPSKYDLRDHIDVEVKNQMETEACWAFSANSSIETNLALKGQIYNFSERHLEYDTAIRFVDGLNDRGLNRIVGDGGYSSTAFTYYSRGSGPILEEDMPFENNQSMIRSSELTKNAAVKKVDDMVYFPNIYKIKDNSGKRIYVDANGEEYFSSDVIQIRNSIKEHIMNYGAVTVSIVAEGGAFGKLVGSYLEYNGDQWPNHAVTVIGWDDTFNFKNLGYNIPNGAYLVLNSWGSEWGQDGIYYISYEDAFVESEVRGVTSVSNIEYDNLYQYDISEMYNYIESKYAANVFTSKENEKLTEIMIGSLAEQTCNVYVNTSSNDLRLNQLTKIASNIRLKSGYNTIKVNSNIELQKGKQFSIVVELTDTNFKGIGIEDNSIDGSFANAISNVGESFISDDGNYWTDIYDSNNMMNLSIKAYTKTNQSTVELINIQCNNKILFEGIGGKVKIMLKTPIEYENKKFDIAIFNKNNQDVTKSFIVQSPNVKDRITRVSITVPNSITRGNYTIKINYANNTILEEIIEVKEYSFDTNEYMRVAFRDSNFYNALKKNVLTEDQFLTYFDDTQELIVRKNIESLDLEGTQVRINGSVEFGSGYDISDISGIEYFTNLKILKLSMNPIEDLKPIENLTQLKDLELYYGMLMYQGIEYKNEIRNVNVIANLTNLETLEITNSKIEDISFITNLKKLVSLNLQQNPISDISPIAGLTNLNWISLQQCHIEDITPLSGLQNLYSIDLQMNQIRDASILDNEAYTGRPREILLWGNYIKNDYANKNHSMIVEVPKIIQQASDRDSVLYSEDGFLLEGCEWEEYGKKIKIEEETENCYVMINSGVAPRTCFDVYTKDLQYQLSSIRAESLPKKQGYREGEDFNPSGMKVVATYTDNSEAVIKNDNLIIENRENLVKDTTSITIKYTENGITRETSVPISVTSKEIPYDTTSIDGKSYIINILPGTTISDMIQNVGGNVVLKDKNDRTIENNNQKLGTEMKAIIGKNEYIIVVTGDLNGDGALGNGDILKLAKYYSGKLEENSSTANNNITKASILASDLNKDESYAGIADLLKLAKIISGKASL